MKIVISGASGLIGSALVPHLRHRGHTVRTLVRREPRTPDEIRWDPAAGLLNPEDLTGTEAVVHLCGAPVAGHRWTAEYREEIRNSRVQSTALLAQTVAKIGGVRSFLSASGMDYYAPSDQPTTEDAPAGSAFLARVTQEWEAATAPAQEVGIPVAFLRTGMVLAPQGGVVAKIAPLVRRGLGGPLGSGQQWWSWITLPDHIAATTLLLGHAANGPVNLVGPQPSRQRDVLQALATAVGKPAKIPAPSFALKLALGDFAEVILADRRVIPARLQELGFTFAHPDLASASAWAMSRP